MILIEIKISDWRCFYGERSIHFATDDDKNVTIIHAENGVGKTTLLNALLWCFYELTTERFERKSDIVNHQAKREGRTTASVTVKFEHNGSRYITKRYFHSGPAASDRRDFVVRRIDSGSQTDIQSPDTFINSVIPRDMASHFLFDGEHAEVFLGENTSGSIRGAVRDILGCSLIEVAIDDLQAISNQFRKQIPSTPATTRIAELNSRLDLLASQIDHAQDELKRLGRHRQTSEAQIDDIDRKLRETGAAKQLQQSRDRLQESQKRVLRRQKEAEDEVYKWIGENGRFIVSKKITEETFEFLDDKQHRGRIPSPYNEEFVRDILRDETCICGAHLEPGSQAAANVARLLEKAANQIMRDRITKVRSRLANLRSERVKAPSRLIKAKQQLADARGDASDIEVQLAEIHQQLAGIDLEDIAERERRRVELRKEVAEIDRAIGVLNQKVSEAERERAQFNREINELAQQDLRTAVYAQRRTICESVKGVLEKHLVEEENVARKVLRAGMRKVIHATSRKALIPKMTNDYVISLEDSNGVTLPKSSGENQLLGLAFTAALIEFAKVRKNAGDYMLLPGTIAPLVLDSPFGQLDPAYKLTLAEFIPQMAQQVVLMVSQGQGTKEVLDALKPKIGAEYVLIRHNRDPIGDRKPEVRYLHGKEIRTSIFDSGFDGTEIVEVASE